MIIDFSAQCSIEHIEHKYSVINQKQESNQRVFAVKVLSFGYKCGAPPQANLLIDVRFLDNPFWIDQLRPLTGQDQAVQDYVLGQSQAKAILQSIDLLVATILPEVAKRKEDKFIIAFGCTGGQHRSVALAEHTGLRLRQMFPDYIVRILHRELDRGEPVSADDWEDLGQAPAESGN